MATWEELKAQAEATRAEVRRLTDRAKDLYATAEKLEREERLRKRQEEELAHSRRMYEEIGQPLAGLNEKQHEAIYAMAWEQGHSSGYGEVESWYGDLAELARKVIELN